MARVFVVDDEPAILELVRRRLEAAGHEVGYSGEALGTTRRLKEFGPDVVVLDLQMPALSGANLIRVLRDGGFAGAKFLLFSNVSPEELESAAQEAGADAFLSKTDGMDALVGKVAELLDEK